ncbi:hypothetical protein BH11PLA1_BH11PLA1_16500 [soil metagenome]
MSGARGDVKSGRATTVLAARSAAQPPKRAAARRMKSHTITVEVPRDYLLYRDVCSYGYFLLEPNHWDPLTLSLRRILTLGGGPVTLSIVQGAGDPATPRGVRGQRRGVPLTVFLSRRLTALEEREARVQIARMLNLAEDHRVAREFHRLDPRWQRTGRARLFRSPTLFEDVIKTVTSCNVTWPSTVNMNRRLCEVIGSGGGFPTARQLARTPARTLRARCSVGYRDQRIVDLAKIFVRGEIDEAHLADPATPDEQVLERLLELPGVGPYAAANIMQLLGRYAHLPLDTESVRHGKAVLGFTGASKAIMKRVSAHFKPFGRHRFRSYWFEMWDFYELKRGKAWTWDKVAVGKTFTASALKD